MAELPTAYPLRDLFDAGVRNGAIRFTCTACRHAAVLSTYALWWHFKRKGWPDRFGDVRRRMVCMVCWYRRAEKVRFPAFELVDDHPTDTRLPMPSELDWKREVRRRR